MNFRQTTLITLMVAFLLAGCSAGGQDAMMTLPELSSQVAQSTTKTTCIGVWQVVIDAEANSADITQLRQSDMILNVLGFLEPPALVNLTIDFGTMNFDPENALIEVDVLFTHPLNTPENVFHGFDVRGVVMGPDVLNADGITPVMNPADFSGVTFGYIHGLLGAPDSYANYDGVWGYKYFADGLGVNDDLGDFFAATVNLDNRGVFTEGATNRRHYDLSWKNTEPPIDFMIFNYAVYANYSWPVGDPPFAIEDYSVSTANCAEAFCGDITEVANSLWYEDGSGGGNVSLDVEIFDWQGLESTEVILFAAPSVPETVPDSVEAGSTAYSRIYHFVDIEPSFTEEVEYIDIFIKATDTKTFGSAWFQSLLPETHDLYDENLFVLFRHRAAVTESTLPTVEAIIPALASVSDDLTDVSVIGTNFIYGPSLGVALKKDGESDIVATSIVLVSDIKITCDISIPGSAAPGAWDVEVTNGYGTIGTGEGLFTIIDCGSMVPITYFDPVIAYINLPTGEIFGEYVGMAATQTGPPFVMGNGNRNTNNYLGAMSANTNQSGSVQYYSDPTGLGRINRDIVCDTQNNVWLTDSTDYGRLRYLPFDASTGFSPVVDFGNIASGWSIWRITIDENDNPVALATSGSSMRVFHWNGSDWDTADIPSSVVGGNHTRITDFDWNPLQNHYVLVRDMGGSPRTANLYAVDTDGNLATTVTNLFDNNNFTNGPGIYIDVMDPACRIITWGGFTSYGNNPCPFARLHAGYSGKVVTTVNPPGWISFGCLTSPRGQWARGTNYLIVGAHYINVWAKVYLPSDW